MGKFTDMVKSLSSSKMSIRELCEKFGYSARTAKWYIKYGLSRRGFIVITGESNGEAVYSITGKDKNGNT